MSNERFWCCALKYSNFKTSREKQISQERSGVGTTVLTLTLVSVFVVGAILGVMVSDLSNGDGGGSIPPENSSTYLNSKIENLQNNISLLKKNLENRIDYLDNRLSDLASELGSGEGYNWPVDEIYKNVRNSIVVVKSIKTTVGFFGPSQQVVQGSGFLYRDEGYILTNHHVIEGADNVFVTFWNGLTVETSLINSDPYSDVALLKVDSSKVPDNLHPLELGDSSEIEPGDRVIAIGNPFGLVGSTTTGIVSQTGRVLPTQAGYSIPGIIQIDAAINPGNSGGPLLNFDGEVIGINTAIESQSGNFSGIGYSVPADLVTKIVSRWTENKEYHHPWVGIGYEEVNRKTAQEKGMEVVRGIQVVGVSSDSPAERAGLRKGDIILRVDEVRIIDGADFLSYIELNKSPGEEISLKVLRDGETITLSLELGKRPPLST